MSFGRPKIPQVPAPPSPPTLASSSVVQAGQGAMQNGLRQLNTGAAGGLLTKARTTKRSLIGA